MGTARTAAAPRAKTVAKRRITLCNVHLDDAVPCLGLKRRIGLSRTYEHPTGDSQFSKGTPTLFTTSVVAQEARTSIIERVRGGRLTA